MIAAMVYNSDWTDDGDVGCKDVELFLRDLLPSLPHYESSLENLQPVFE